MEIGFGAVIGSGDEAVTAVVVEGLRTLTFTGAV